MSIRIGSNISSLQAQRRLSDASNSLSRVFERLSSGQRINRASDDAAGLAVSTSLRLDSRVFGMGLRNINDGISALSIADGALGQLSEVITRQAELATQASNGTFSTMQRLSLQRESDALTAEFNRVIQSTTFNGRNLFSLDDRSMRLQLGYGTEGSIDVSFLSSFTRRVGTGSFTASLTLTTELARSVDAVDFNGDGHLDMINSNEGGAGSVSVRLNNGDGTFGAALSIGFGGVGVIRATTGDINGDGILDIAVAGSGGIGYVLGNGNGTFGASVSTALASGYTSYQNLAIGDVNGDGVSEIVAVGDADASTRSRVNIYSTSGATLSLSQQATVIDVNDGTLNQVELGDFNGDGILDIVTIGDANRVSLLVGNGNGTFQSSQDLASGFSGGLALGIADYDRDGDLDIAALSQDRVMLFQNSGSGSFTSVLSVDPQMSTSFVVDSMRWADVNGDGLLDIAFVTQRTSASATSHFNVLYQNGDGSFSALNQSQLRNDTTIRSFAMADLNGDGVQELIGGFNGSANTIFNQNQTDQVTTQYLGLLSEEEARSALGLVQSALERISKARGLLGANQSRLGIATGTLRTQQENYLNAMSQINDADIATESSELTRLSILQQAGRAVLAQANLQPSLVLRFLQG